MSTYIGHIARYSGLGSVGAAGPNQAANNGPYDVNYVKTFQQIVNDARIAAGLPGIAVDGDAGPETCAALQWYAKNVNGDYYGIIANLPHCSSSGSGIVRPKGPATPYPAKTTPAPKPAPAPAPAATPSTFDWKLWLTIAGGVLLGLGAVYTYKHHGLKLPKRSRVFA